MQPSTVNVWLSGSSVWKTRPCALSLNISPFYQIFCVRHAKRGNLHPAGIVRPSHLEIGNDAEYWPPFVAPSIPSRKFVTDIVVTFKPVWATTNLLSIHETDHEATISSPQIT